MGTLASMCSCTWAHSFTSLAQRNQSRGAKHPFSDSSVGSSAWLLTRRSVVRAHVGEPNQSRAARRSSSVLIRRRPMVRVHPREPTIHLGVAQWAARVIWDHEAAGSRPAAETILFAMFRVLGCGRSSVVRAVGCGPTSVGSTPTGHPQAHAPSWRNRKTRRS
jgi:hypothetical protein